ncbi:hypothetical protein C0213_07870 [Latilactobacillus sakei]|nr:leucine-rich repeat domain-containing protein [Latilactobacillus sakei]AUX12335.1 hypothetical protein C0213_07870 [Latilactobacillus sakei]
MKRKKRLVLTALITCLGVFLSVGIYLVVPKFLAGDTQVADLTLKSQVNNQDQTIQLTITDQNQADTKVVVPLTDKLSYTPTTQPHAGVTYDQVNHQIVIDWLAKHPKTVNLTVKAAQAGTYVFKAQTTRNDTPVNTAPTSVTITPVESTPTSSIQSNNQATLSEKVAVPGLQEPNTTSSQSLATKEATQQQKNSTKDLPDHADTDIVTTDDFDNQRWLLAVIKVNGFDISQGNVTFGDLKKITRIDLRYVSEEDVKEGYIPRGIEYLPNVKVFEMGIYTAEPRNINLSGTIPAEIGKLKFLKDFKVYGVKNFCGGKPLPKELFDIPTLDTIELGDTNVSGELPENIGNAQNLKKLTLNNNNIKGSIPESIGNCKSLEELDLSDNDLEGNIPSSYANLPNNNLDLSSLFLSGNHKMMGIISEKVATNFPIRRYNLAGTQLTIIDPQSRIIESSDVFLKRQVNSSDSNTKQLINYINPVYKDINGWVEIPLISGSQKIKVFDNLNANLDTTDKHILNLGLGSRTVTTGDTTPLLSGHTYQIIDTAGKTIYDGPADPSITLSPTSKDTQYVIRMDHTQETLTDDMNEKHQLIATIVLDIEAKLPKVTQSFQAEDPSVGAGNQIKYVKNKPFKMISILQNDDAVDFKIGKMNEKIKAVDKDKVSIDPATFEMQKPNTSSWEAIPGSDVQENADGYQVNVKDIDLKPTEKIKLRYSVTAKEAFTDTAILNHQVLLSNTQELPALNNDMTIKNGQLLFTSVPGTMSFANSQIANMTTEIKRKLSDWKMQIEDTRLNKTDWHITANLVSELKNSNGDSLGDSVIFKKTGQPNQVINTTNAVDVYDGKSSTADYQDVQWAADAGPTLSIAPGLAKLGSYTGTMQWTLVDAPA